MNSDTEKSKCGKQVYPGGLPIGAPPGTLIAKPDAIAPKITLIAFDSENIIEREISDIDSLKDFLDKWPMTWINVDGLGDIETIEKIGDLLKLHKLALEDVLDGRHRAKVEEYDNHLFVILRMVSRAKELISEQLSIFVGEKFLVTFQEIPGDCLDPVRERLRKPGGKMRQLGPGYLAYAIIDAVIDGYYPVMEVLGESLEDLEDEIIERPDRRAVNRIHIVKRDLLKLRRTSWPLREVTNTLVRDKSRFINETTQIYLRDCYDHIIQVIELVENYREVCSDLMDVYLSSVSNRMNEVMKVLTIIATIFIPLTFIVGLYGMNFNTTASRWNMPELNWPFGYPFVWIIMVAVTVIMLIYFYWRGWLSDGKR